ncbi:MAG: YraN family protein [Actinomycetota bacterium]
MSTQRLKVIGENAAANFLTERGFRLVARNWRTRFGELDLVAMEGRTLVFVEVKARQRADFIDPALGVDYRKQVKLRRLATAFLAQRTPSYEGCRFDVISVVAGQSIRVTHIIDAF